MWLKGLVYRTVVLDKISTACEREGTERLVLSVNFALGEIVRTNSLHANTAVIFFGSYLQAWNVDRRIILPLSGTEPSDIHKTPADVVASVGPRVRCATWTYRTVNQVFRFDAVRTVHRPTVCVWSNRMHRIWYMRVYAGTIRVAVVWL